MAALHRSGGPAGSFPLTIHPTAFCLYTTTNTFSAELRDGCRSYGGLH